MRKNRFEVFIIAKVTWRGLQTNGFFYFLVLNLGFLLLVHESTHIKGAFEQEKWKWSKITNCAIFWCKPSHKYCHWLCVFETNIKSNHRLSWTNINYIHLILNMMYIRPKIRKLFDCPLITYQDMGRSVGKSFFFFFFFFFTITNGNIHPTHVCICL